MPAEIEFWFEFASPYTYVAALRLEPMCAAAGVRLCWVPFLLGPVFALQGWETSHFNLNPRRGAYMWRDLERLTGKFGLPWTKPATTFPKPTTLPARVAAANAEAPWIGDFVRRVFVASFGEDAAIGDEPVVTAILAGLGLDAPAILADALSPVKRGILRANTERAIELGIFGSPNLIVRGELFWGEETLEDAIAWATGVVASV